MGKLYFLFGIHNHQPVGNFLHIFEQAFEQCYYPFISILQEYPRLKCNLHISGPLYDWILQNRKWFLKELQQMVDRGQIEIISGGYYEPILPLIPDEDKIAQIRLMNDFIKKVFHITPSGFWLAERVWEPYLAKIINETGLKYTFLDDTHFRWAGLQKGEMFGYYVTEESLKSIFVFPISKTLRYKIPFSQPEEAIEILRGFCQEGKSRLVTLFDDGEKFGLWPYTFDWVYKKGWLRRFFTLLEENGEVIETITASRAIELFMPEGLIYLPTASYQEMGEWVLEPDNFREYEYLYKYLEKSDRFDKFKNFVRGGFFRNFYRKYPRLNYMHKRMLFISKRIHSTTTIARDKEMFFDLWKGQCNCGYWHGIFGGFYLGHIRGAIYENLIRAENRFDEKFVKDMPHWEKFDIDLDGKKEVLVRNKYMICVFAERGGVLLELSLKMPPFNLLNTITRRQECYHSKVRNDNVDVKVNKQTEQVTTIHNIIQSEEKDLDKFLVYDKYERVGLIDHILKKDFTLKDFNNQQKFKTLSDQHYRLSLQKEEEKIVLEYFYPSKQQTSKGKFCKRIIFNNSPQLKVCYTFYNTSFLKKYNFGIEFNFSLFSLESIRINGKHLPPEGMVFSATDTLLIEDLCKGIQVNFKFDRVEVYILPIYIVSSSETGFKKSYQQIAVLLINSKYKEVFHLTLLTKSMKKGKVIERKKI